MTGRARPFGPQSLIAWLLTGDEFGSDLRLVSPETRLEVLLFVADRGKFAELLGNSADAIQASEDILVWLTSNVLLPIPRHYQVMLVPPGQVDKTGRLSGAQGYTMVRVAHPPADEIVDRQPEDAL